MELKKIVDGKRVSYKARVHTGQGRVVETYRRKTGHWVIIHDKKRNVAITVRPSQVFPQGGAK